jgi:hypothetical protein
MLKRILDILHIHIVERERIDAVSKYVADLLVKDVYRQIRGTGKAIAALKERGGSSRQAILKYIMANFNVGKDAGCWWQMPSS